MALLYCFLNGEVSVCPTPTPGTTVGTGTTRGCPKARGGQGQFPSPCPPVPSVWCLWVPAPPVSLVQVQAEIRRNWGTWQRSMESNVFNLATQDFTA